MLINNRIYNTDTNSRHWAISLALIIILSVIMAFIPFVGLCLSLMFFRQRFAPILFIIFSFYFGWFYEPQMDLLVHYEHFHRIADKSLVEQWMDSGTSKYGKEIYPVLFKYFIGLIADNRNFFSACACVVYTSLFIFGVVKPLQPLYMQKMSIPAWLLFLGVIFTVEYYWFLGFRFWSGAFVFTGFYLRYLNSGAVKYLWLSALCICFHYSLFILFASAIVNNFLRCKLKFYYLIFIISFIVRITNIALIAIAAQFDIFKGYVKDTARDQNIIQSVERLTEEVREHGNQFYLLRETFAVFGVLAVIYMLYKKTGKEFLEQNVKLWGFCILLLSLANFGYASLTFYDRFFKLAVLFLYVFAYMWIMNEQHKLKLNSLSLIAMIATAPVLYFIITPLVEQRQTLFQLKLWFSNLLC